MKKSNKKDTSWDPQSKWYNSIVGEDGSYYHKELIVPNLLQSLGDIKNKKILDLGCGQGFFCRILAQKGAIVNGIDLSKNLIRLAQKYPYTQNIRYFIGNAQQLSSIISDQFDFVISILSIGNMENIEKIFKEVYKVLKEGGKFNFVIIHPCFRIPRQSYWEYNEKQKLQFRAINRYMTELAIPIITHPGTVKEQNQIRDQDYTLTFHRPLSILFYYLKQSGFVVSDLQEWCSNKKSSGKRAKAENRARKEIPLFLFIEALKIKRK